METPPSTPRGPRGHLRDHRADRAARSPAGRGPVRGGVLSRRYHPEEPLPAGPGGGQRRMRAAAPNVPSRFAKMLRGETAASRRGTAAVSTVTGFSGWNPHGNQRHWNSCTALFNDTEHYTAGPGPPGSCSGPSAVSPSCSPIRHHPQRPRPRVRPVRPRARPPRRRNPARPRGERHGRRALPPPAGATAQRPRTAPLSPARQKIGAFPSPPNGTLPSPPLSRPESPSSKSPRSRHAHSDSSHAAIVHPDSSCPWQGAVRN